jgi:hypothetical protein
MEVEKPECLPLICETNMTLRQVRPDYETTLIHHLCTKVKGLDKRLVELQTNTHTLETS